MFAETRSYQAARMLRCLLFIFLFAFASGCRESERKKDGTSETAELLVTTTGRNEMILLTERPPNLETPLRYFLFDFTPNSQFFVRWHLAGLPQEVDSETFRLKVAGHVSKPLFLSLHDLRAKFKPYSIVALAQCAGNARSFFDPRVPGGQWKNGAMGNARWTGVRVKDILEFAGVKPGAIDISFNGMDAPPMDSVPDFVKSLRIGHAMDGEVLIAYEMNGEPLPLLNGYPLKLVVPGWYATYWIGMLNEITVHADTFKGFWMQKAYLVPKGVENGNENPDNLGKDLTPISRMDVRSIFVMPEPGGIIRKGEGCTIQGLAFDGGYGIAKVELSADSGRTWQPADLHADLGVYSWRRWSYEWKPENTGTYQLAVKATNAKGETQPRHQWNRSGYMRNEIETLELNVK